MDAIGSGSASLIQEIGSYNRSGAIAIQDTTKHHSVGIGSFPEIRRVQVHLPFVRTTDLRKVCRQ